MARGRGGTWQDAEGLNPSVRKDVQVRILPPLPTHPVPTLHVYLNAKDTRVIDLVAEAMRLVSPIHRVGFRRRTSIVVVNAYSQQWPTLFPQHGPGTKHLRPIVLAS